MNVPRIKVGDSSVIVNRGQAEREGEYKGVPGLGFISAKYCKVRVRSDDVGENVFLDFSLAEKAV